MKYVRPIKCLSRSHYTGLLKEVICWENWYSQGNHTSHDALSKDVFTDRLSLPNYPLLRNEHVVKGFALIPLKWMRVSEYFLPKYWSWDALWFQTFVCLSAVKAAMHSKLTGFGQWCSKSHKRSLRKSLASDSIWPDECQAPGDFTADQTTWPLESICGWGDGRRRGVVIVEMKKAANREMDIYLSFHLSFRLACCFMTVSCWCTQNLICCFVFSLCWILSHCVEFHTQYMI